MPAQAPTDAALSTAARRSRSRRRRRPGRCRLWRRSSRGAAASTRRRSSRETSCQPSSRSSRSRPSKRSDATLADLRAIVHADRGDGEPPEQVLDWAFARGARLMGDGMPGILDGLRVIEGSAYVAAPLGGMTLAQLGADVIRFDQIGGGLDRNRWPVTDDGESMFWAGLNKGKRSIQVDLRSDRGKEILTALIAAPGDDSGILLTNFPAKGWLDYEALGRAPRRPDHGRRSPATTMAPQRSTTRSIPRPASHGPRARATSACRSTTCFRHGTRSRARLRPPASWPPSATAAGPARASRSRVALSDVAFAMVGQPGQDRRGAAAAARAPEGGQLPLRRLWPRLPHLGRPSASWSSR